MDTALVLQNLLSPAILFFFLGVFAVLLGSDLEIPAPLPKLFSLYLLLSIGFKGGVELQASGLGTEVLLTIGAALLMAVVVPLGCFGLLRTQFDVFNAAALAGAYGSISAVTFITAESFLRVLQIDSDGYMVAALALMESPAIIVALLLVKLAAQDREAAADTSWGSVLHEAFLNSSVFLLVGSLLIGLLAVSYTHLTLPTT